MASYSIMTAALAIGTSRKRLENLLGRCELPGTRHGRQGRARRLGLKTILAAAATLEAHERLGLPIPVAARLASRALEGRSENSTVAGLWIVREGPVALGIDLDSIETTVFAGLSEAVEIAPRPVRGRPLRPRTGGLRHRRPTAERIDLPGTGS